MPALSLSNRKAVHALQLPPPVGRGRMAADPDVLRRAPRPCSTCHRARSGPTAWRTRSPRSSPEPPEGPFTPEVIAVPTRGMERWLTQRLSARLGATPDRTDGICANVEFPFPGRLIGSAIATASGIDPADDPWPAERSVWRLLDVVEGCLHEPWLDVSRPTSARRTPAASAACA